LIIWNCHQRYLLGQLFNIWSPIGHRGNVGITCGMRAASDVPIVSQVEIRAICA
jgi:hypothetical protein